jgi:hypothetical protein
VWFEDSNLLFSHESSHFHTARVIFAARHFKAFCVVFFVWFLVRGEGRNGALKTAIGTPKSLSALCVNITLPTPFPPAGRYRSVSPRPRALSTPPPSTGICATRAHHRSC